MCFCVIGQPYHTDVKLSWLYVCPSPTSSVGSLHLSCKMLYWIDQAIDWWIYQCTETTGDECWQCIGILTQQYFDDLVFVMFHEMTDVLAIVVCSIYGNEWLRWSMSLTMLLGIFSLSSSSFVPGSSQLFSVINTIQSLAASLNPTMFSRMCTCLHRTAMARTFPQH